MANYGPGVLKRAPGVAAQFVSHHEDGANSMAASPQSEVETGETPATDARYHPVTCFSIRAFAEPGVMPRVLEVFAKRSLVPVRWHADRIGGADSDELAIDLQVADLSPDMAAFLARCLRQIWGVETVLTAEKGYA
jgi:acetolactate synthase regulatory subunit